jgi:hypothetical protein
MIVHSWRLTYISEITEDEADHEGEQAVQFVTAVLLAGLD